MKALLTGLIFGYICMVKTLMASPIAEMQKVGHAKLEVLFWDIYQSSLYSPNGKFEPNTYPMALQIQYLRDIKADDLIKRTAKEWDKLGIAKQTYQAWVPKITEIWPDIKKGDELMLVVDEGKNSQFYFNQKPIGTLEDKEFGPNFLAIWLDENASFPKLRKQLIGAVR